MISCQIKKIILILFLVVKPQGASQLPYPLIDSPALPVLPNFVFPPAASPTTSLHSSSKPPSPKTPQLKPMLLWIDSVDNDPKTTNEIRKNHPTLEIHFISTYKDAEQYINQHLDEIQQRQKFIIICRGYYASESKSFTDIAGLIQNCNPGTVHLGVYTKSRTSLLEKTPNPPEKVEIFDTRANLHAFVNRHLSP
jgi:hypothetical protein